VHDLLMYIKTKKMDNQQLDNLTNEETQLLLSLYLGDGSYTKHQIQDNYSVYTSSINEDLLRYKKSLVTTLTASDIKLIPNPGYKKDGTIFKMSINSSVKIGQIYQLSLQEKLDKLDKLGLALWFYDDGSLHKKCNFYNLCTHSFSIEDQMLMLEKLKEFGIYGKLLKEKKRDGRVFWYIYVSKYNGAFEISKIMAECNIESMKYKLWSPTTILKWSTVQEDWKSRGVYNLDTFNLHMRQLNKSNGRLKI